MVEEEGRVEMKTVNVPQIGKRKNRCEERLILLSLDAVGAEDLNYLKTLPNFSKILNKSAICERVNSVYPSLTYPAHTSIVTGKVPNHHGVVNNTLLQPHYEHPDWASSRKHIKGTTLYEELRKKGWKTAALLWPVTGHGKITYNFPEIHANRWWESLPLKTVWNGSFLYSLQLIPYMKELVGGIKQPLLDDSLTRAAEFTLRKKNPNLLMVHFLDVDEHRHIYGVNHEEVTRALERTDRRLGELYKVLEETGDMNKTTLVILGDHYQKDTKQVVYFNHLLKQKGYLKTRGNKIVDYRAVAKNCDGSCYIYVNSKCNNEDMTRELTEMFFSLKEHEMYGIDRIYTGEEAGKLGADMTCLLMIEARDGYYYLDEFEEMTKKVDEVKAHKMKGTHGYLPDQEGYHTFFMASGYGIREGEQIPEMTLMDEGATLARLFEVDLGKIDGKVIEQLLK